MQADGPPRRIRPPHRRSTEAERRRRLSAQWALVLHRFRLHVHDNHDDDQQGEQPMASTEPTSLRRPPIRQSTTVRSDGEHTFDAFVRTIGEWWPVRPYSLGEDKVAGVTFERELGGRVYETWDDGHEVTWGHVTRWDPPTGFTMTWEILPAVTEVELRFRPLGPALTRVDLEHRGWEQLTEEDIAAVNVVPGAYEKGWETILSAFALRFEPEGRAVTSAHFVYKLIPPRPTFALDMSDDERAIMGQHTAYWTEQFDQGRVVVFGPVLDPAGAWGLGVVEADGIDAVRALGDGDPAVRSGTCTYDVFAMLDPSVRPAGAGTDSRRPLSRS